MIRTLLPLLSIGCVGNDAGSEAPAEQAQESPAESSVGDALARLQAQDPGAAAGMLEQVVEREPDHARAWTLLGRARKLLEDYDGALAAYARAAEADPQRLKAIYGTAAVP